MAFDSLSKRLNTAFKNISGNGKLTESNMEAMLKEVRVALLEADVNYRVVKNFLTNVKDQAIGQKVFDEVDPSQMIVKIVHDEIVKLLGDEQIGLNFKEDQLTTLMMVGLQGTGKTTSIAKIANLVKNKFNKKPLLVAADIIRPAAIEQLKTLGSSIGVEVFSLGSDVDAVTTVKEAIKYAQENSYDTLMIDTAGRLHIDDILMQELKDIKQLVNPDDILLTVDAMTGQDIVEVAQTFNDELAVSGLVVTKFDGDSRGGGVLSVRSITGVAVKFVGQGEKIDDLDLFYPDRMADRILGMGDIVSLVEKAQEKIDIEESEKIASRMFDGTFTMDDMLTQMEQVNKLGSIGSIMKMIPGLNKLTDQIDENEAQKNMKVTKAIIQSMTKEEKQDPSILNSRRKKRIALGSGTTVKDVAKICNQFEKMKKMMKQLGSLQKGGFDMSKFMGGFN